MKTRITRILPSFDNPITCLIIPFLVILCGDSSRAAEDSNIPPIPEVINSISILKNRDISEEDAQKAFQTAIELIGNYYLDPEIDPSTLYVAAIQGMVDFLNCIEYLKSGGTPAYPLSRRQNRFLLPSESARLRNSLLGKERGFGITVTPILHKGLYITHVLPGSSADKGGIRRGEIITHIDEKSLSDLTPIELYEILIALRTGKESFKFSILDPAKGSRQVILHRSIMRKKLEVREVKGGNVLYIKIPSFFPDSYEEFKRAISQYLNDEKQQLFIDLRGTDSGNLKEMLKISELFIPYGKAIIRIVDRREGEKVVLSRNKKPIESNIILYVDSGTTSIGEAFVSSLMDNPRVTVIGHRTAGVEEGVTIFPLQAGLSLEIVTSRSLPVSRDGWGMKGLKPEIERGKSPTHKIEPSILEAIELVDSMIDLEYSK